MESLCQVEEKRQNDLDTVIMATREKLEVSSAIGCRAWVLRAVLPPERLPQLTVQQQH